MCEGKVFAKEGADGLLGLGLEHPSYPKGLGIVIKLAHGWDTKAMSFLASHILRSLGFFVDNLYSFEDQEVVVSAEVIPPFF
jgi:L-asparaginase II